MAEEKEKDPSEEEEKKELDALESGLTKAVATATHAAHIQSFIRRHGDKKAFEQHGHVVEGDAQKWKLLGTMKLSWIETQENDRVWKLLDKAGLKGCLQKTWTAHPGVFVPDNLALATIWKAWIQLK